MAISQKYEAGGIAEEAGGTDCHEVRHSDPLNSKAEKLPPASPPPPDAAERPPPPLCLCTHTLSPLKISNKLACRLACRVKIKHEAKVALCVISLTLVNKILFRRLQKVCAYDFVASCRIDAEAIINGRGCNGGNKQSAKNRKLFSESIYAMHHKLHSPFPSMPITFSQTQPMKIYT